MTPVPVPVVNEYEGVQSDVERIARQLHAQHQDEPVWDKLHSNRQDDYYLFAARALDALDQAGLAVSEKPDPCCTTCDGTGRIRPGCNCGCSEPSEKPVDQKLRERIAKAIEAATSVKASDDPAFWSSSYDRDRRLKQADAVLAVLRERA